MCFCSFTPRGNRNCNLFIFELNQYSKTFPSVQGQLRISLVLVIPWQKSQQRTNSSNQLFVTSSGKSHLTISRELFVTSSGKSHLTIPRELFVTSSGKSHLTIPRELL